MRMQGEHAWLAYVSASMTFSVLIQECHPKSEKVWYSARQTARRLTVRTCARSARWHRPQTPRAVQQACRMQQQVCLQAAKALGL